MEESDLPKQEHILNNNDLAFERTVMAENRTLMAWVRTAMSLISFGFTIYKFFQETIGATHKLVTPRRVGMFMIGVGVLSLLWGWMEHKSTIKKLRRSYPALEPSKVSWLAMIILLFGISLFVAAFFRQ